LTNSDSERVLVFSLALNYYEKIYGRNIDTHRRYTAKFNFDYLMFNEPGFTPLLMESAWLKIPLLVCALRAKYDWVMYLDIDTCVQERAPDFRSVFEDGKDIYLAPGFTNRINSGVVIVKNCLSSETKLIDILRHAGCEKPPEDRVGWGENGDFIYGLKNYSGLKILSKEWNNNHQPLLKDFIRHYSAGPLRKTYKHTEVEINFRKDLLAYVERSPKSNSPGTSEFYQQLYELHLQAIQKDSRFSALPMQIFSPSI
jgi:hypothetical protein